MGHLLPTTKELTNSQDRCSCDNSVNTAGSKLIKLCNNHSLRVANGGTPGDRGGNYTCFNNGGASVVNYLLTEIPLHKNILDFKVLPPEFDSKHAPITALCDQLKEKNKPGNIQDITKAFKKILTTISDKSLTIKRKKNTQKRHSKPWYNNSCSSQ